MTLGLVIGKFMPVHQGHIALINFAARQCDTLIVSMSFTKNDPIDGSLRFSWLKEIFIGYPNIQLEMVEDNFDDESLQLNERINLWANFIRKTFPPIDRIFTSEQYGDPLALLLSAEHIIFDPQRKQFPIAASLIRARPFHFWKFIPPVVRPHYVKIICFFGPESTGKSTMAKRMAEIFQTEFVPEVAREIITSNDFSEDDIIRIGYAQTERVLEKLKTANKILFCDTDLITTEIYSRYYLKTIPPILFELEKVIKYDQYFLFDIDVPWVMDGLRDLGSSRLEMLNIFKNELLKREIPYISVNGNFEMREQAIKKLVANCLL